MFVYALRMYVWMMFSSGFSRDSLTLNTRTRHEGKTTPCRPRSSVKPDMTTTLNHYSAQANKALSLKSDLLSATSRLQTAEADKVKAITTCREADDNRLVITAAVDELAELASEVIPPLPPFETSFTQGRGQNETKGNKEHAGRVGAFVVISEAVGIPAATVTNGRSVQVQGDGHACGTQYGYGSASHCRRDDAMKKLAEVDIKLRRRGASELTNTNGRTENGAERGPGWIGSGDREGGLCAVVLGNSEIRRAVRAVRALADAGVRVAADRDRAIIEVCVYLLDWRRREMIARSTSGFLQNSCRIHDCVLYDPAGETSLLFPCFQ